MINYHLLKAHGEMSEWSKEHAWKACIRATVSRVQIPFSPPEKTAQPIRLSGFLLYRYFIHKLVIFEIHLAI